METRIEKIVRRSKSFRFAQKDRQVYFVSKVLMWAFCCLVVFCLVMPWQQTAEGAGRVVAFLPGQRVQTLTSPLEGRIKKWHVQEGQRVNAGDLLAELEDIDPEILDRIQTEIVATRRRKEVLAVAIKAAQNDVDRQKALFLEGISSEKSVELAKIKLSQQQNELASAQGELARLLTKNSRQSMQRIEAKSSAIINSILVGENFELIKTGQPLATVVPETPERFAELLIHAKDLPFISQGQKVLLQFEGWPILQLSGIPELSIGTFAGSLKLIDSADDGNGRFRVIVEPYPDSPWPKPLFLKQGLRAKGWIQMAKVPVWFEIWRNLLSLPPQDMTKDFYTNSKSKTEP